MLLTLKKTAFAYPSNNGRPPPCILQDLNLELRRGELACLIGPSGSGKSTLLRVIAGFEVLQQGHIVLDGTTLADGRHSVPPHLRHIGFMFQDYALFSHLSVAENIAFGLTHWPTTKSQARTQELLDIIDLQAYAQSPPSQLSGGQQQRVALARALAPKPKLLLLDEPFSNLDAAMREPLALQVRSILKNEGIAALLVTHDQLESFALADSIGVLHHGNIVQWAAPQTLYQRPQTRFVAEFVGLSNFLPASLDRQCKLHTELGVFPSSSTQQMVALSKQTQGHIAVQALLRPQDIAIDASSPHQAQLLTRTFRGENWHYHMRLSSQIEVCMSIPTQLAPSESNTPIGSILGLRVTATALSAFAMDHP